MITTPSARQHGAGGHQEDVSNAAEMGTARRRAISALVAENIDAFAQRRRKAQRAFMHALERATSAADIQTRHGEFAVETARAYAAHALQFQSMIDDIVPRRVRGASARETEVSAKISPARA